MASLKTGDTKQMEEKCRTPAKDIVYLRDVLYGYISLTPLARKFIDTPDFQVLRHIKQLGTTSHVFPSANHTRFEHSIGVYHLCGRLMRQLSDEQPELFSSNMEERKRFIDIVAIAGLLHDIGHCAESHAFDSLIAPKLGVPHHEERGVAIIRKIITKYEIPVTKNETELIINLILGNRDVEPTWLASIVNDTEGALDMDKLDYLNRDSYYLGFGRPIQEERILLHARVRSVPVPEGKISSDKNREETKISSSDVAKGRLQICYHRKVLLQLIDVFQTRSRLFREVYRHKTVVGLDELIGDIMCLLLPVLSASMDPLSLQRPTDAFLASLPEWLPFIPASRLSPKIRDQVLSLWNRLQTRKLYKVERTDDAAKSNLHVTLGLSAIEGDPLKHLWFIDGFAETSSPRRVEVSEASAMLAAGRAVCSETVHYTLDRSL